MIRESENWRLKINECSAKYNEARVKFVKQGKTLKKLLNRENQLERIRKMLELIYTNGYQNERIELDNELTELKQTIMKQKGLKGKLFNQREQAKYEFTDSMVTSLLSS